MFQKVLIANRGEIAVRVISACKDLGIRTVAVYSEADRGSLHVRYADEALCIGPPRSADSYLNIPAVISAAEITDVDAIHPGYGFLAEDPGFAEVCEVSRIKFIGPRPDVIRLMGDKAQARRAAKKAGIPIVPGTEEPVKTVEEARKAAKEIGYPVIVKAAAGGGGRGMRVVQSEDRLAELYHQAQHEAAISFHSSEVYIERFIERPRHIEFQVLGDEYGRCVAVAERECSIQRRHQKLLEEGPSPSLDQKTRERMCKVVGDALSAIGYSNAGTAEFLMDQNGDLFFIELNARIQVEHPVTEAITGIDLVRSQILLAAGEPLDRVLPEKIQLKGHAIECRINAENPETFAPSAGRISQLIVPGGIGVRVDTAAYSGWFVPPYYDSLVAKLVVHGKDREEAIARTRRALDFFTVEGIHTSISLHQRILTDPEFLAGRYDTHFIERMNAKRAVR